MSLPPHRPLLLALAPLSSAQWRCLRVVSDVSDVAHAARKLHWSQPLLKATLAQLQACVGAPHLALRDERVQLSPALQELVRLRPPCRLEHPAGPGAEAPPSPAPSAPPLPSMPSMPAVPAR